MVHIELNTKYFNVLLHFPSYSERSKLSITLSMSYRISSYFQNDQLGCNTVSWAPYSALGSIMDDGSPVRRLVTGSCDNTVRIWAYNSQLNKWQEEVTSSSPHTGKLSMYFLRVYFFLSSL